MATYACPRKYFCSSCRSSFFDFGSCIVSVSDLFVFSHIFGRFQYWLVRFLRRIEFSRVARLRPFGFLVNHYKGLGIRSLIPVYVAYSSSSLPLPWSFQNSRNMTELISICYSDECWCQPDSPLKRRLWNSSQRLFGISFTSGSHLQFLIKSVRFWKPIGVIKENKQRRKILLVPLNAVFYFQEKSK